jgi:hypothetical protein
MPLVWPDGRRATAAEIGQEWARVKAEPGLGKNGAGAARDVSPLRLLPDGVRQVTMERLDAMLPILGHRFPRASGWPAPAQLGLLSMAWALGAGFKQFPKLELALQAEDFEAAKAECTIKEADNPGVVPRNKAQRALFAEAAESRKLGRDPSVLFYSPA